MGCDIHCCIEKKNDVGQWELVELPPSLRSPRRVELAAEGKWGQWAEVSAKYEPFNDRYYDLFAVLANVQNGYGFAGVKTGGFIKPISEPRGFPDDLSPTVKRWTTMYEDESLTEEEREAMHSLGDHSFSWLTAAELAAYDWDAEHDKTGVIPLADFAKRVADNVQTPPESWCGATFGHDVVTIPEAQARTALSNGVGLIATLRTDVHVQIAWRQPTVRPTSEFRTRVIPGMLALHPDPTAVRLIFGFDS